MSVGHKAQESKVRPEVLTFSCDITIILASEVGLSSGDGAGVETTDPISFFYFLK